MKKASAMLEKWGYLLLTVLCVGVIVFSAVWTKRQDADERTETGLQAAADGSQRLSALTPSPEPTPVMVWEAPVLRGFSAAPVYFAGLGLWQTHESVDFAVRDGQEAFALKGGTVRVEEDAVYVTRGEESERYRGLREVFVRTGQTVAAGERLGLCGGSVPFEGTGHLCVTFFRNGTAYDGWAEYAP